jgi:hypothetical protein
MIAVKEFKVKESTSQSKGSQTFLLPEVWSPKSSEEDQKSAKKTNAPA